MGLTPGEHLRRQEIFQIFVVSDDVNSVLRAFEVMVPDLEAFENGE